MTRTDGELDLLLAQFWRDGGSDSQLAEELHNQALHAAPVTAMTAGRCMAVLELLPTPASWEERVATFRETTARLVRRCHQVDQLGDLNTKPEAIFAVLADEGDYIDINDFDSHALHTSRIGKPDRATAAQAFLETLGWANLAPHVAEELKVAIEELRARSKLSTATALFESPIGPGLALGVNVAGVNNTEITGYSDADQDMTRQVTAVLRKAYDGRGAGWGVEWEVPFGGSSIGLALWIAAMVDMGRLTADPVLAATGRLDPSGNVCAVGGIASKVHAAIMCGFRRVLVPIDNEAEASEVVHGAGDVTVIGVKNIDDLSMQLRDLSGAVPIGFDGSIRYVRKLIPLYELDLVGEHKIKDGYRIEVADAASKAQIDVFHGRRGTIDPKGSGSALQAAKRLVEERLPASRIERRDTVKALVAAKDRRENLVTALERAGADRIDTKSQYEAWRFQLDEGQSRATVVIYNSGKVVVSNGTAPAHDTLTVLLSKAVEGLGGAVTATSRVAQTTPVYVDDEFAHIGTDEAGKGDYFGPLVCAACYLDPEVSDILRSLGVRDSKTLSDKTISRLASDIRSRLGGRFSVVTIQPKRYNELTKTFRGEGKNLNSLVAWGHSRGIKDLVVEHRIDAEYAVIDKFADERYMRERLSGDSRTRDLRLDLRTKGESDIAVAAASILARDAFVRWLDDQSKKLGLPLPKGAGGPVIEAARRIVAERGVDALDELAKTSFKTTKRVLDTSP